MSKNKTNPFKISLEIKFDDIEDREKPLTQKDFITWCEAILIETLNDKLWIDTIQSGILCEWKYTIEGESK